MNSHPITSRAVFVVLLAVLALTLLPVYAQEPAPTAAPMSPAEFMSKMLKLITDQGTNREVPSVYANALGFTNPPNAWKYRGIIGSDDDEHQHSFNLGLESSREIAIVIRNPKTIHANRVDANGQVLAAIEIDLTDGECTTRAPADAQDEVNAEIALWTEKVDRLLAGKKETNSDAFQDTKTPTPNTPAKRPTAPPDR